MASGGKGFDALLLTERPRPATLAPMKTHRILCVALTPAWQEVIQFDAVRLGAVNRASDTTVCAAGKGVNVAKALQTLGGHPLLLGFVGGPAGRLLAAGLRRARVPNRFVVQPRPTRVCRTLVERGTRRVTELVEEAPLPDRAAWRKFFAGYRRLVHGSRLVVIAGAPMPGAPADVYARLAREARNAGVPVIMDSRGEPLLGALPFKPLVAKLNREELEATVGRPLFSTQAIIAAARRLIGKGAQHVVVTAGSQGAWLVSPDRVWRFAPPPIKALNPIGSGDAMTAGIAFALARGFPLTEAVRRGVACGTANALTLLPADLAPSSVRRLISKIVVVQA